MRYKLRMLKRMNYFHAFPPMNHDDHVEDAQEILGGIQELVRVARVSNPAVTGDVRYYRSILCYSRPSSCEYVPLSDVELPSSGPPFLSPLLAL